MRTSVTPLSVGAAPWRGSVRYRYGRGQVGIADDNADGAGAGHSTVESGINLAGIIGYLMHFFFDLDHTVIDSSHRQITRPDGSLDLAAWGRNNTRANIMRDTLLPLAAQWRLADKKGATIVICTARVMGEHDFEFLRQHGLRWDDSYHGA